MHDSRDDKPDFVNIMLYFEMCSIRECCAACTAVAGREWAYPLKYAVSNMQCPRCYAALNSVLSKQLVLNYDQS